MKVSIVLVFLFVLLGVVAKAQVPQSHRATADEMARALEQNQKIVSRHFPFDAIRPSRPVSDFHTFKYLLMEGDDSEWKQTLAKNLPPEMTLVLLTDPNEVNEIRSLYSQWLPADRLILVSSDDAQNGFWARDSFPYPVFADGEDHLELIGARYFRPFTGGQAVADAVHAPLRQETFSFVGGDLQADEDGRCFVVDSDRLFGLTDDTLENAYGCREVVRLPLADGIGDVDEVVKLLPNHEALTTISDYIPLLEKVGYHVTLLPRLTGFRTYANAVMMNGTVFMPVFDLDTDSAAQKVYESFGYKVVTANSEYLSTAMMGSFHCSTMAYPDVGDQKLLNALKLQKLK